jgi:hypothetical protein
MLNVNNKHIIICIVVYYPGSSPGGGTTLKASGKIEDGATDGRHDHHI